MSKILDRIKSINKGIAVLVDPDKFFQLCSPESFIQKLNSLKPDFLFIGGSTVDKEDFDACVAFFKKKCAVPLVIFPGRHDQVSSKADAILILSLLSGNNSDYLNGQHILASELIERSCLETIPTAYLLIDGGVKSAVERVTNTKPIHQTNTELVRQISLAAKHLGMHALYLDAGSGALNPVHSDLISAASFCGLPLIVGGGIKTIEKISELHSIGAHIVVVGNHLESNMEFFEELKVYKNMGLKTGL